MDNKLNCLTDLTGGWKTDLIGEIEYNQPDEETQFKMMSYNIVKELKINKSNKEENDENITLNASEILKSALKLSNRKSDHFDDINGLDNQETVS